MILDTYTIWICPHCEYWSADHEHEDIYNSIHLSMHAGCDQPFAPLTGIVCKPIDGAVPNTQDGDEYNPAPFIEAVEAITNEQTAPQADAVWNQPVQFTGGNWNWQNTDTVHWVPTDNIAATTEAIPPVPVDPVEIEETGAEHDDQLIRIRLE